jgi:hypothetical protein
MDHIHSNNVETNIFVFVTAATIPDLRLNKLPNQTVQSIVTLRVRRQGREAVHLPPSTAVINQEKHSLVFI